MRTELPNAFTDRLAELVSMLRNRHVPQGSELRWRTPLVRTAIDKLCAEGVAPAEIGIALFRVAEDLSVKSPILAAGQGAQWADTRKGAERVATPCPKHPGVPLVRCACQREQERAAVRRPDNFADLVKAAQAEAQEDS